MKIPITFFSGISGATFVQALVNYETNNTRMIIFITICIISTSIVVQHFINTKRKIDELSDE